jgi:phospholipase C
VAYVSHTVGDHTSILALIEKRYLGGKHLTARDAAANDLEDMFDFNGAPSMNATVNPALATPPSASDPGC